MIKSAFNDLDKYQKIFEKTGKRQIVFVGSMMDIFEDNKLLLNPIPNFTDTNSLRNRLFTLIDSGIYNGIVFLFLTKRPQNISKYERWSNGQPENVWYGTSISSRKSIKYAEALKLSGGKRLFLSIEPQVGLISKIDLSGIGWVIQGGESGQKKRPFDLRWAVKMREICKAQNVPYFFKQIDKVQPIPKWMDVKEFPNY